MSAEATGWVWRNSPLQGAQLLVHLAIADSVNDQHHYELWARQSWIARKSRTTRQTTNKALATLIDQGMLALLEESSGGANRYRFLMPDVAPAWTPEGVKPGDTPGVVTGDRGVKPGDTGVSTEATHRPRERPTPTQEPLSRDVGPLARFDDFWTAYPRKTAKGSARKAWGAAVHAARGDADAIIAGAQRYADDPNRDESFTAHPATWLRGERWDDPPLPPRRRPGAPQRPVGNVDTDRGGDSGRLEL